MELNNVKNFIGSQEFNEMDKENQEIMAEACLYDDMLAHLRKLADQPAKPVHPAARFKFLRVDQINVQNNGFDVRFFRL